MVSKFSFTAGLCAVRPGLLGVRRAHRDVKDGVRVAENRGEDVSRFKVSARDEARNLDFSGVIARLSSSMDECSDRVVAAGGLAQGAGGVGGACVQASRLAGSAGHQFTGFGAAKVQAHRVVEARLILVHLEQPLVDACVHASGDEGLDLQAFAARRCSPTPSPS